MLTVALANIQQVVFAPLPYKRFFKIINWKLTNTCWRFTFRRRSVLFQILNIQMEVCQANNKLILSEFPCVCARVMCNLRIDSTCWRTTLHLIHPTSLTQQANVLTNYVLMNIIVGVHDVTQQAQPSQRVRVTSLSTAEREKPHLEQLTVDKDDLQVYSTSVHYPKQW